MSYVSPWFLVMHVASRHVIHPYQGEYNPPEGRELVVHRSTSNPGRLKFRFVQKEGHWGYFQHSGGRYWHPEGNYGIPSNDRCFFACRLTLRGTPNDASLFTYDAKKQIIMHKSGFVVSPTDFIYFYQYPEEEVIIFYKRSTDDWSTAELENAKFKFVTEDLSKNVQIFPNPTTVGEWRVISAYIDPIATHTKEITFKQGKSKTTSNTIEIGWDISVSAAIGFFEGSSTFSYKMSSTTEATWYEETEQKRTITVTAGKSVVTWQWQYGLEQWNDKLTFKSNILADTESMNVQPTGW